MRFRFLAILAMLLSVVLCNVLAAGLQTDSANSSLSGQWMLEKGSGDNVQFTVRYQHGSESGFHSMSESHSEALSSLKGVDLGALNSSGTKSQFDVVRDAGTFHCQGWFANGSASGHWTFAPNAQFASALAQREVGTPDGYQAMRLAMGNASLEFVDTVRGAGYHFDVEQLIKTVDHGVSLQYVKGMADLGYTPETLAGLIKMRDHGVDSVYVKELMAAGLGKMSYDQVIKMRDHGVDAAYMRGLATYGIKGLSGEQLAQLRDHGVDPEFISEMQRSGINSSTWEWVRLRDHGVDPSFVKAVHDSGLNATTEELVRLRDHGVDSGFISQVRAAGFKDLSPESFIELRDHGVGVDYLKQFGTGRSVHEVVRMHDTGVRASM